MNSTSAESNFQKSAYVFENSKQYQPTPVNSSYAFEHYLPALSQQAYLPEQKNSQYELESMRNYPAGEFSNYHYVKAEELSPLYQPTAKAEIFTRKDLLRRVEQLDSGFYQPVISCGQLHFVSSGNDNTQTARSAISQTEDLMTAISERSLKTARSLNNSIMTAKLAGSESNLNRALVNVKKITPEDISFLIQIPGFKESLAQFKNDRKSRKSRKRNQESTQLATGISNSATIIQMRTGREASLNSTSAMRTGKESSDLDSSNPLNLKTGKESSEVRRQSSVVDMNSRRHISRFERSQLLTPRQNSQANLRRDSQLRTGLENSISPHSNARSPKQYNRSSSGRKVRSASNTFIGESNLPPNANNKLSSQTPSSEHSGSSAQNHFLKIANGFAKDMENPGIVLKTGRSLSELSTRTALDGESSKDVLTALLPSAEEDRQLYDSLNELNSVAAKALRTPSSELTARQCASATERMTGASIQDVLHTPQDFDRRASQCAANLGSSLEHRIISEDSDLRTAQKSESFN